MKIKLSTKVAMGTFITSAFGVLIFALLSFLQVSDYFKLNLQNELSAEVSIDAKEIKKSLDDMVTDVKLFSSIESISGVVRAARNRYKYDEKENLTLSGWMERLTSNMWSIFDHNKAYFQITLIGMENNGRELIRLDKRDDYVSYAKADDFAELAYEKFFKESMLLKKGEAYISEITVYKDRGNIVFPLIPTITVTIPLFDGEGELFGLLSLKANVYKLFNMEKMKNIYGKSTYLANADGYYLYNEDIDKVFSLEFGKNFKIQDDFSIDNLFKKDIKEVSFFDKNNFAFQAKKISLNADYNIILARQATNAFLEEQSKEYTQQMIVYIIIISIFIAMISALLTRYFINPIVILEEKAKSVAQSKGEVPISFKDIKSKDEIGDLAISLELMLSNLLESKSEISKFASSLEYEVEEKTKELRTLNEGLEKNVDMKTKELQELNENLEDTITLRTREQEVLLSLFDKGDAVLFKWDNDENWSIASVSQSVEKLLEYTTNDFLSGKVVYANCIHGDDLKYVTKEVEQAIDEERYFFKHKPYRVVTKRGHIKWIHDFTVIVRDENANVINFVGYLTDITELKTLNDNLENKVNQGVEEMRNKDDLLMQQAKLASMGEMMGAIAHQWRQPLNALAANIQFLDDDYEDELVDEKFVGEFIGTNMELINFMSNTIDDFRNFFRVDKVKVAFNIKDKISETINILSEQLKNHNIEISINKDTFETIGYPSEFQQVILNIINNSKDALIDNVIENAKIEIAISIKNSNGIIEIKDNGGGVPLDVLNRVFEPYFTTKEQGKGTGIGLYMSKIIIVENMNGKINIKNSNSGAIVTIELKAEV